MFRVSQNVRSKFRSLSDSVRFMSKAEKRRFYYGFAGVSSATATGLYVAIHTSYIDTVVGHLQMYHMKFGVPVNPVMLGLLEETMSDMQISLDHSSVGLFNFVGGDVFTLGSLYLPSGAFIGIPFNLNKSATNQLRRDDIRLLGRYKTKRTPSSSAIQNLFGSLILSTDAKKYCLAHELNQLSSSYFFAKTFNIFLCSIAAFMLGPSLNRKFSKYYQKRTPRFLVGLASFTVVAIAGLFVDEMLDQLYDIRALKRTLEIGGESYQQGAIEYYTKLTERNKVLYELLDLYGPKFYTSDGSIRKGPFGLIKQNYQTHCLLASKYATSSTSNPQS